MQLINTYWHFTKSQVPNQTGEKLSTSHLSLGHCFPLSLQLQRGYRDNTQNQQFFWPIFLHKQTVLPHLYLWPANLESQTNEDSTHNNEANNNWTIFIQICKDFMDNNQPTVHHCWRLKYWFRPPPPWTTTTTPTQRMCAQDQVTC